MADKKVTELPELTAFNDNDKKYIVDANGVSKFVRHSTEKNYYGQKNKHTGLDEGGENPVTAEEIVNGLSEIADHEERIATLEAAPSGSTHDKGYFPTETALTTAHATGEDGDFAIVGATDTFWIWDSDTSDWVDSGGGSGEVDLSDYVDILNPQAIGGAKTFTEETTHEKTLIYGKVTATIGASYAPNGANGNLFDLTVDQNGSLADPTNLRPGAVYVFRIKNNGGFSLSFSSYYDFLDKDTPTIKQGIDSITYLSGVAVATNKIEFPLPGGSESTVKQYTGTATLGKEKYNVFNSGLANTFAVTLPTIPPKPGQEYVIYNKNTNVSSSITVANVYSTTNPTGGTETITGPGASLRLFHDGSNYWKL